MTKHTLAIALGAIAIGAGIAAGGYFVSQTMLNQRIGANIASVKGLSEKIVAADAATWNLSYSISANKIDPVAATFSTAEKHMSRISAVLESAGFAKNEFLIAPLQKRNIAKRIKGRNGQADTVERYYTVSSSVFVSTNTPSKIAPAQQAIANLSREGIDVIQQGINYEFTKLNDIKPDMLREATENARIAADKFAENAGVKVGGIQRAIQGGFSVGPANTGDAKTRRTNKLVRVVTTITFYLEN